MLLFLTSIQFPFVNFPEAEANRFEDRVNCLPPAGQLQQKTHITKRVVFQIIIDCEVCPTSITTHWKRLLLDCSGVERNDIKKARYTESPDEWKFVIFF